MHHPPMHVAIGHTYNHTEEEGNSDDATDPKNHEEEGELEIKHGEGQDCAKPGHIQEGVAVEKEISEN